MPRCMLVCLISVVCGAVPFAAGACACAAEVDLVEIPGVPGGSILDADVSADRGAEVPELPPPPSAPVDAEPAPTADAEPVSPAPSMEPLPSDAMPPIPGLPTATAAVEVEEEVSPVTIETEPTAAEAETETNEEQEIIPLPNATDLAGEYADSVPEVSARRETGRSVPPAPPIDLEAELPPDPGGNLDAIPATSAAIDVYEEMVTAPAPEVETEELPAPTPAPVSAPEPRDVPSIRTVTPRSTADPVPLPPITSRPPATDYAIAELGGLKLMHHEFYDTLKDLHGRDIFQRLLSKLLLRNELERRQIVIGDDELNALFQKHVAKMTENMPEPIDIERLLRYEVGMSTEEYKNRVVWTEIAMRRLVNENLSVSDADLFNFYYANRDKYTKPEEVHAFHVLVDPAAGQGIRRSAGTSEWEKAYKKARRMLNRIRTGEVTFEELALKENDDKAAARHGGDLGFFARGTMVKPFEDAAFSLQKGEISDLVKTIYGYHILKVVERTEARLLPFSDVRETVREDYQRYLLLSSGADLLERLRREAYEDGRLSIHDPDFAPRRPPVSGGRER